MTSKKFTENYTRVHTTQHHLTDWFTKGRAHDT